MNTKKALTAVMVLLILLNIALGIYLIVLNSSNKRDIDILEYTKDILGQRNITMSCLLPESSPRSSSIVLGDMIYDTGDLGKLASKTGGTYEVDFWDRIIFKADAVETGSTGEFTRVDAEELANAFMNNIGLHLDDFHLDSNIGTMTDEYTIKYIGKSRDGILYFDSYIEMKVGPAGVHSAKINIRTINADDIVYSDSLPIHSILLTNLKAVDKPLEINDIAFGYHLVDETEPDAESVMCWRVQFEDSDERFYDVGTGEEINPVIARFESLGVSFTTKMPSAFIGYSDLLYTGSIYSAEVLETMPILLSGNATIGEDSTVVYVRTNFENSTIYNLEDSVIDQICRDFISGIGLNIDYFVLYSNQLEAGSGNRRYVLVDDDGIMHPHNFVDLHFDSMGVALAYFRHFEIDTEQSQRIDKTFINILLNALDLDTGQEYIISGIEKAYMALAEMPLTGEPCWVVTFEDGTVRYLSVFDGEDVIEETYLGGTDE